ncbi:unnamed protein product [Phytomonas sp. Hart1]|nr:unnamed protein product [Phytomonas sp. Hart1]|eukprot:CCW71360.1 unnamed protein product [Phytomonas sp. isolate Hart1]
MGRAVARTQVELWAQQLNLLLFHIALWQRRHPLGVLSLVLEQYRRGQMDSTFAASSLGCGSYVKQLGGVLEAITNALYPGFSSIPGLIRCDVFMTYPHMPVHEQLVFMREVTNRCFQKECKTRNPPEPPASEFKSNDPKGADGVPPSVRGSKDAIDAEELLYDYNVKEIIPDLLITTELTDTDYQALRVALERHKKDGVRRLATETYTVFEI